MLNRISNLARSQGDPKVVSTGPSSLPTEDRIARALGWFSIGLGVTELVMAPKLARALGMRGQESLVRAFGAREIAAGVVPFRSTRRSGCGRGSPVTVSTWPCSPTPCATAIPSAAMPGWLSPWCSA